MAGFKATCSSATREASTAAATTQMEINQSPTPYPHGVANLVVDTLLNLNLLQASQIDGSVIVPPIGPSIPLLA